MKKILLIIIIIGLFSTGGAFAYDNRYLWIPMSEEELRQKVSDFFYVEMDYESCVLNDYSDDFNSKENCQGGIRCMTDKFSNIVPEEDLRRLVHEMRRGEMAESAVISYFEQNTEMEADFKEKLKSDCSMWLAK